MILYDYKRAPNARRVRIFLAEKKINIEIKNVDLMKKENIQDDFLKINPSGTVPFLQIKEDVGLTYPVHSHYRSQYSTGNLSARLVSSISSRGSRGLTPHTGIWRTLGVKPTKCIEERILYWRRNAILGAYSTGCMPTSLIWQFRTD